jgi:hypothetical protein
MLSNRTHLSGSEKLSCPASAWVLPAVVIMNANGTRKITEITAMKNGLRSRTPLLTVAPLCG